MTEEFKPQEDFAAPSEDALKQAQEEGSATLSAYAGEVNVDHASEPADIEKAIDTFTDKPDVPEEPEQGIKWTARGEKVKNAAYALGGAVLASAAIVGIGLTSKEDNDRTIKENPSLNGRANDNARTTAIQSMSTRPAKIYNAGKDENGKIHLYAAKDSTEQPK